MITRLVGLFVAFISLPVFAQERPAAPIDKPYTVSVDVDLVQFNVSVLDKKGHVVSGLDQQNFRIYEDGHPQDIRVFHPEDAPATVGVVIDNSGSMVTKRAEVIKAATDFLRSSNPRDEVFIVTFNENVSMGLPPNVPFSNDFSQLHDALSRIRADGRTALYDAIAVALQHLDRGTMPKKAVVVLSDGGDNASHCGLKDVLRMSEKSSASIYTIGIYDESDHDRNPKVLRQLAKLTGGEAYIPRKVTQLDNVWRRIAGGIRNQYTIGYVSTNPARDGKFRNVKVSVTDKNGKHLEVRTRTGYLAATQ